MEQRRTNKPYTRMWLYGFNVDEKTIDDNLRQIKESGLGGIELQILYPVEMEGNIDFFSPDFFKYLKRMVQKAADYGLDVDLTLGSGWPFGASFISKEMSPDILLPYQQDIIGPTHYSSDFTCVLSGKIVSAVLCKVEEGRIVPESLKNVTDHVHKTYIGVWPWGEEVRELPVGKGVYRLYLFVSNEYRQRVGKAAPNMDGYAMDHCREEVTDLYLEQLGNTLLDSLEEGSIRSVFCDSIELTASNWTKYLLPEFERRRGYDLTPYMPALWQDIEGLSPYIRADYYRTYGELTVENFFARITQWAEKRGVQFRLQAHGTWADIIDAYSVSHIPEGETFGIGDFLEVNIKHRRLAVSAAMHRSLPLVSNETYTWLRKPRFLVTLEMMKKATDACFVDGINHIINHGYSFYKGETFENLFYASSVISPHNSWWEYYPLLAQYITNCCKYLQSSPIQTRVAVLTPTTHIWASNPMAELHMSLQIEKLFTVELANRIASAGYWFAFVNDARLQQSEGVLTLEENRIECLIVPRMEFINRHTLQKLLELADSTTLLFLDRFPHFCDTFVKKEEENRRVAEWVQQLREHANVHLVTDADIIGVMQSSLAPDLVIQEPEGMGYIVRKGERGELYTFVANISDEGKEVCIHLPNDLFPKVYDPMQDKECDRFSYQDGSLVLFFEPNQSYIIEQNRGSEPQRKNALISRAQVQKEVEITGWTLYIQGQQYLMEELRCWETMQAHAHYSGKAEYVAEFELDKIPNQLRLQLAHVHEVCEVWVNGKACGTIWKRPYHLNIASFVQRGGNTIRLVVSNLLFNAALAFEAQMPQEKLSAHKPYLNYLVQQERLSKVDTFRERDENLGLQKSGLEGRALLFWE